MSFGSNSNEKPASPSAGNKRRGVGRQGNNTASPRPTKRRSGKPVRKPTDPAAIQALEVEKLMKGGGITGSGSGNSREKGANSTRDEDTALSSRIDAFLTTHSDLPSVGLFI